MQTTSAGYQALSEKEKQTLRLIVRGHDAKSVARHLQLSVHTVNERLRDARRKLGVSSSRAAARMVFETEDDTPQTEGDKPIGDALAAPDAEMVPQPGSLSEKAKRTAWIIGGTVIMSIILAALAFSHLATGTLQSDAGTAQGSTTSATQETDATRAARAWLVLSDEGRWAKGYNSAGGSFRKANTVQTWTNAATQVRVPLGALVSRTLISQEDVPAGPGDVQLVKFRTSFANKAEALETLALRREGGQWRVVGIYLE
jgi:DNA-binding CsgD family transcriptional regulator